MSKKTGVSVQILQLHFIPNKYKIKQIIICYDSLKNMLSDSIEVQGVILHVHSQYEREESVIMDSSLSYDNGGLGGIKSLNLTCVIFVGALVRLRGFCLPVYDVPISM